MTEDKRSSQPIDTPDGESISGRSPRQSIHGIEQDRRDFMRDQPDLYVYIAYREACKALDHAGDLISGHHEAANRVWGLAGSAKEQAEAIARGSAHE